MRKKELCNDFMVNLRAYLCDMLMGKLTSAGPQKVDEVIRSRAASSPILTSSGGPNWASGQSCPLQPHLDSMHLKRWLGQQAEIETTQNLVISVLRSVNFEEAQLSSAIARS